MTSPETIRTDLARLWDTGANAYELAQAVMRAADIESADLELEVEGVISRALLAREFVDLSKLAAEVAKVLPGAPGVASEPKPEDQKQADAPNYEAIAYGLADLMASLLLMLRPTPDWMGTLMNGETGEKYAWEEAVTRLIEKLPGLSVDRRYLKAKGLPAKERRKRYRELELEKQAKEQAA